MAEPLPEGVGVLVTRPRQQSAELIAAIDAAGGRSIAFPAIEIAPRCTTAVEQECAGLHVPDIVIYVSRNAVEHGLAWNPDGAVAAVGPSTAAALEAAGRVVDIVPARGFDSESLLAEPAMNDVAGKTVRIVRGNGGRELLAETLRERGASVEYLAVYERRLPSYTDAELDELAQRWDSGDIDVVTVMSVESLKNLLTLLPASCVAALGETPLVTPAARVLKEAQERLPGCTVIVAAGPAADEMVRAIATLGQHKSGRDS
jgi:uroporphyrinogen-III synthase